MGKTALSLFDKVWVPKYRWELVGWLGRRYPEDKLRFGRMSKKQLYSIYFNVRKLV